MSKIFYTWEMLEKINAKWISAGECREQGAPQYLKEILKGFEGKKPKRPIKFIRHKYMGESEEKSKLIW